MLHITRKALEQVVADFSHSGENICVRILPQSRTCTGAVFRLERGVQNRDDVVHEQGTVKFVISRELIEAYDSLQIQYIDSHWGGGHLEIRPLVDLRAGTCGDCRC